MVVAIWVISTACRVIYLMLLLRCICSWMYNVNSPLLQKADEIATGLTEWLVSPCRKLIAKWNNGMFDFSVLIAFFALELIEKVLIRIIMIAM